MEERPRSAPRDSMNGIVSDVESNLQPTQTPTQQNSRAPDQTNGKEVWAVSSSSVFRPKFDLSHCRDQLDKQGFQVPPQDFEAPLQIALGRQSVRRYLFFNSNIFNFILAPVIYLILWCAVYSTVHVYLVTPVTDFWVLCLCVSLISVLLSSAILLTLHHSSKEISANTDARLILVNERLSRHRLLIGVADWVTHCTGTMQLFCLYWDLGPCVEALAERLAEEDAGLGWEDLKKQMKKRMSRVTLVTEITTYDPDDMPFGRDGDAHDEERPLLGENEDRDSSTTSSQREETKLTKNISLVPDLSLPPQDIARQLLLTYSSSYVKLLVSDRLPRAPRGRAEEEDRSHCKRDVLCLCQYVRQKVLQ